MSKSMQNQLLALVAVGTFGCAFSPGQGQGSTGTGTTGTGTAANGGGLLGTGGNTGITGAAGNNGGSNTGVGNSPGSKCGDVTMTGSKLPPDIILVQDKSGSMANDDTDTSCRNGCGAMSKWSELTTVLTDVLKNTDMSVNWGLKFFASPGNSSCTVNPGADVPIAMTNSAAVLAALGAERPSSNTPTRKGINAAAAYLMTLTDSNPKYILLATDGLPNCPDNCRTSTECGMVPNPDEVTATTQAITMAASMGYRTFVVGIGNVADGVSALNAFANAGGVPQMGAATSYYAATDSQALEQAFNTIVGVAASCNFAVPTPPPTSTRSSINVQGDGKDIPKDTTHMNGWDYTDQNMTSIQVYGSYCDQVKAGQISAVTIIFKCVIG